MLAFRIALRDLRGGIRGLRILLACLALGVAAIAAVGSLRVGVERGLAANGRQLLGGDIEVQGGAQPLPDTLRTWLRQHGARLSDTVTMRSMLVAPSGARELVELKAVDGGWPLVGAAAFDPGQTPADALGTRDGHPGLAVEQVVLDRLGLKIGDPVRLGTATLALRGVLTTEPDRVSSPSILGARALVAFPVPQDAGLLQPGSLAEFHLRAAFPAGTDIGRVLRDIRAAFPNTGWRLRDAGDAAPGVIQFVDRTSLFLTLVGLTSLLVGGIGVANGVRAWLDARSRSIATLRCLGASARLVLAVCLIEVMALALAGIVLGVVVGAALPAVAVSALGDLLPVRPELGLFPAPLGLAALYGLLVAGAFALWPLGRAMRIPGGALFRDPLVPARARLPAGLLAANAALGLALVAVTIATAEQPGFAAWFCAAAIGTLALFRVGGSAVMRLAAAIRPPPLAWARLGLGLSTPAAVALIEGNVQREISDQMPSSAPTFFFVDIQNDQLPRFEQIVATTPGTSDLRQVPSLRARIVAVNGVPADQVHATDGTAWALRGDRGLTYAAAEPEGTKLVAGSWWPAGYTGPPLASFDANLARGWGVKVGDVIRVNVLGRDIDLKIANLRDIAWRSLGLNFTLVASPGLLEHAPHMHIATVRAVPAAQGTLLRAVTDALPNVSGIRVADVLGAIAVLLSQLGAALIATGSLTLMAGALVLAGAVAAGQQRRIREAVILKTLGATRAQVRGAWLVEFGLLGLASGVIAAVVGTAASFAVVRYVMHTEWSFLPGTLVLTVAGCVVLMLGFGYIGTEAALRAKAAPLLRNE
ncbi:MAG TPA: FtsX-like permease family protein [Acetobacteraceae bacterium]|nr:FtsX-like permease family protein [Acetobacteraceae bacterium]